MDLLVFIILGICAVGLGFYLGLPGTYEQTPDEIEKAMERGGRKSYTVKRTFTPLDWLRKDRKGSERRRQAATRRFRTAAPEKKK